VDHAVRLLDRWTAATLAFVLLAGSLAIAVQLNFWKFTDEQEPYVYVQTLPDINKLMTPLEMLTQISPAYFHLRGHILLEESDSHPLPWLLADFSRVDFLDEQKPPEQIDADFLIVDDSIVSDIEERLKVSYFKDVFDLRGGWGKSATLFLKVSTFGPLYPGRAAEFTPGASIPALVPDAGAASPDDDSGKPELP
jgi:hypothetical protein